ncbi:MAG: hypothetical protein AAF488_15710 [Planctomycetota bacterium]
MVFTLHVASSAALVGLIWLVQRVQYPGFLHVPRESFAEYHAAHCRRITEVVAPLMLVQLGTGALWLAESPASTLRWVALSLVAVPWISTALIQVPYHQRLSNSPDDPTNEATIHSLIRTNWIRTIAWTAHAALLVTAWNHTAKGSS